MGAFPAVLLLFATGGFWCQGASATQPLRLVKVIVEADGGLVAGLSQERFQVYEGNQQRPILFFGNQPSAGRIVVLLDYSESMLGSAATRKSPDPAKLLWMNDWVDELAVLAFDGRVRGWKEFGSTIPNPFPDGLLDFSSRGTALHGALLLALDLLSTQIDVPDRAVLILSDGEDIASRAISARAVNDRLRESGVRVYALSDPHPQLGHGRATLRSWTSQTGGLLIPFRGLPTLLVREPERLAALVERILDQLRVQYTLGFRPVTARKIDVKLTGAEFKGRPTLRILVMPSPEGDG
jgi:hypothetical protein